MLVFATAQYSSSWTSNFHISLLRGGTVLYAKLKNARLTDFTRAREGCDKIFTNPVIFP